MAAIKKFNFLEEIKKDKYVPFFFIIISFAIFFPSFINLNYFWDDERFVFLNPAFLQAPSWVHFWNPASPFNKSWPLGYSIFWFLHNYLGNPGVLFYKTLNIILHALNATLIYKLLKKIKLVFPFLLSVLFLVHPLHVETVSWIFQILTILALTFFLISLNYLINYSQTLKIKYILLCFIFFLFSIWTKSIAILAPLLFLLVIFSFHKQKMKSWIYLAIIPFFIASILIAFLNIKGTDNLVSKETNPIIDIGVNYLKDTISSDKEAESIHIKKDNNYIYFESLFVRPPVKDLNFSPLKIAQQGIWHYFSHLLLPTHQQFIYKETIPSVFLSLTAIGLLLALPVFMLFYTKDKRFLLIPGFSLAFLTPYLGINYIAFFYWSNVSDRYTYFFVITLTLAVGLIAFYKKSSLIKKFIIAYIFVLSFLCISYGFKFNNPLRLYEEIIVYKKSPVIYSLLFEQYLLQLRVKDCERVLNEFSTYFPGDPQLSMDLIRFNGLKTMLEK